MHGQDWSAELWIVLWVAAFVLLTIVVSGSGHFLKR
jgi:hypothetical protein